MDVTITAIDTIGLRIPFDIGAPPPMTHGVPRTHIEGLYIRVATSAGVVGWGESFGTARPMVIAAFDHWIRRLVVGQVKHQPADDVGRNSLTASDRGSEQERHSRLLNQVRPRKPARRAVPGQDTAPPGHWTNRTLDGARAPGNLIKNKLNRDVRRA